MSYLQEWSPDNGSLINSVKINESLSSLAVRDDGRFVAIGTMFTGSVSIYIAFSLQRVLHIPSAHLMFVTGLEFLPSNNTDGPPISSNTEAAVLSISVDNNVCIHSLQYRREFFESTEQVKRSHLNQLPLLFSNSFQTPFLHGWPYS